ncbi:MAG: hypothetical protein QM817_27350 [Archangium sp.]
MSLVVKINSPQARMWLQEARTLWSLRKFDKAADRAAKVVKAEGQGVFAPQDKELLAAALKRIAELKKRAAAKPQK